METDIEIEIRKIKHSNCEFIKNFIEKLTKLEFSYFIGFGKYEHVQQKGKLKNYRNGFLLKNLTTSCGKIKILIPRDRLAEYDSNVVKKHKKTLLIDDNRITQFKDEKEIDMSLLSSLIRDLTKINDQKTLIDMTFEMKDFIVSIQNQNKNASAL